MNDGLIWICAHQELVETLLVWAFGVVPAASVASWWARFMPPWVQTIVQLLAMNFLHAMKEHNRSGDTK